MCGGGNRPRAPAPPEPPPNRAEEIEKKKKRQLKKVRETGRSDTIQTDEADILAETRTTQRGSLGF